MEDIVAVRVVTEENKKYYFLTWGRVLDEVNDKEILSFMEQHLLRFGITNMKKMALCEDLQEASHQKYFYESFFLMSQQKIPFGKKYAGWQRKIKNRMLKGKEIYRLG